MMHTLDIIFAIIGIVFLFIGIKRGLTGELFRIVAMVAGFIAAFLYYNEVAKFLTGIKLPLHIKNAIGFFLLYLAVAVLILLVGWLIKKVINMTVFGWVDRLLGGGIGLFKAAIIAWAVCLSISSFPSKTVRSDFSKSVVYSTYKKLPQNFHLKAMLAAKDSVRSFLQFRKHESIDKKTTQSESVKMQADSLPAKKKTKK